MLIRLNRNYTQTGDEVKKEFPDCHFLMVLDDIVSHSGYLIAISEEPETNDELCKIQLEYSDDTPIYIGGTYKNATAIGLQTIIE